MSAKEKITLVCTSNNPDKALLNKMLNSACRFDEIILHINKYTQEESMKFGCAYKQIGRFYSEETIPIADAYNWMIESVTTEWICCFSDDDYFYTEELYKMINEIHKGIDADVAHFKFHVSGYIPPQDLRCWFGKKEYDLCEKKNITPLLLEKHNRLPAGSFFRKSAWEKVGGFQGDKFHDWNLWERMAKAGCVFKYFDYLVYNYVRRENSAWIRQECDSQSY